MQDRVWNMVRLAANRMNYRHRKRWIYARLRDEEVSRYDSRIDPYKLHEFDPAEIIQMSGRQQASDVTRVRDDIGDVCGGDWDRTVGDIYPHLPDKLADLLTAKKFVETPLFQSLKRHFENDVPWEETVYYRTLCESVDEFSWHGCDSAADVDGWVNQLDTLYTNIRDNEYRAFTEINDCNCPRCLAKEVAVDISRDGEPLFVAGRHRLSIAKLLDLDTIPCIIVVRHRDHF